MAGNLVSCVLHLLIYTVVDYFHAPKPRGMGCIFRAEGAYFLGSLASVPEGLASVYRQNRVWLV